MFERYTEKARRVIFFARYEASQFGTPSIETEHLLLGLLREDGGLANRVLPAGLAVESIRQQVESRVTRREKFPTSVDLPLSTESKRVLDYSAKEADRLLHKHIGTEHLLLGLLREKDCLAAQILHQHGLHLALLRKEFARRLEPPMARPGEPPVLHTAVMTYLRSRHGDLSITSASETQIRVKVDDAPETPPFLWIEIITDREPLRAIRRRIDQYFSSGAGNVWLLDLSARHAYVATPETGLREFKGQILSTKDPVLELPLEEIFRAAAE